MLGRERLLVHELVDVERLQPLELDALAHLPYRFLRGLEVLAEVARHLDRQLRADRNRPLLAALECHKHVAGCHVACAEREGVVRAGEL